MAVIDTRTPTLPDHLLIDGQLTHGAGEPLVVVNPATEEPLGTINAATPAQADDAVRVRPARVRRRSVAAHEPG